MKVETIVERPTQNVFLRNFTDATRACVLKDLNFLVNKFWMLNLLFNFTFFVQIRNWNTSQSTSFTHDLIQGRENSRPSRYTDNSFPDTRLGCPFQGSAIVCDVCPFIKSHRLMFVTSTTDTGDVAHVVWLCLFPYTVASYLCNAISQGEKKTQKRAYNETWNGARREKLFLETLISSSEKSHLQMSRETLIFIFSSWKWMNDNWIIKVRTNIKI